MNGFILSMGFEVMEAKHVMNYSSVSEAVKGIFGNEVSIVRSSRIGGGDINEAAGLVLSNHHRIILKSNRSKGTRFFEAEAQGLAVIRDTGTIAVPEVLGQGTDPEGRPRDAGLRLYHADLGAGSPV